MKTFDELLREVYWHHKAKRFDRADRIYRELLRRRPRDAQLIGMVGRLRVEQGRFDEALQLFEKALRLDPNSADHQFQYASVLRTMGRWGEAIAPLEKACSLATELPYALSTLVESRLRLLDWADLDRDVRTLEQFLRANRTVADPFQFLNVSDNPEDQLACARGHLAEQLRAHEHMIPPVTIAHKAPRQRRDRIRIGYVSADFREHPVAQLMCELIELHDRSRFEVIGLSIGKDQPGSHRERLQAAFERFIDTQDWLLSEFTQRLHALDLDILVDLMGHTALNQIQFFARRPAPVQVTFLGYPGTTGGEFMDYVLVDPFVVPAGMAPYFSEKLVHLPDCYQPNDRKRPPAAEAPARAVCGLPDDAFVFCCFNNSSKILPHVFDVWMRILHGVPGSVLWLLEAQDPGSQNIRREAQARGIEPSRLIFAPKLPLAEHLARLRNADIVLDTQPYNAHTTASDALWVGVPIVTCPGRTFAARVAGSLLHAIRVPELIAGSLEEYESLAIQLAKEPERLREIRARLAANRDRTPLFDTPRFTRHIERAYVTMYDIWCAGETPRAFAVEPLEAA